MLCSEWISAPGREPVLRSCTIVRLKAILLGMLLSMISMLPLQANAQVETNERALSDLADRFRRELEGARNELYFSLLASQKSAQAGLNQNPNIRLMYMKDGKFPFFYSTCNQNAARTISTDDVWPGGSSGFQLTGTSTGHSDFGIWDVGGVLTTHEQFGGRVLQMDSPDSIEKHPTHVAGTMIASGAYAHPSAIGMSYEACLSAYDIDEDLLKMTAAAPMMNVSNHSYGPVCGWFFDSEKTYKWYWLGDFRVCVYEDYQFGRYSSESRDWDELAYVAPYYSIVKSAGNDRNDTGPEPGGFHYVWDYFWEQWLESYETRDPDGGNDGYDCIPPIGTAKNILTVGAVGDIPGGYSSPSSVVMEPYSSWGPTDDGRIKPDLALIRQ